MTETQSVDRGGVREIPQGVWPDRLLVLALTALTGAAVWPMSPIPMGDDAAFAETARIFAATGHIQYTGWASMVEGWHILWGALFIRLFGYSAGVLAVSTLVVGLCALWIWHGVLLRFGISRRGSMLGAAMVGCSPLYIFVLMSYLTDVHGFFAIVLCVMMCQRAVLARSDRATAIWLASAGLVNIATGTVRQVCWLGALVMVPAVGWYLRRRKGVLATSIATAMVSLVAVACIMRWFNVQPYTLSEKLIPEPIHAEHMKHLLLQWGMASLLFVVVLLPLTVEWGAKARIGRFAWLRASAVGLSGATLVIALRNHPSWTGKLAFPWIDPVYEGLGLPHPTAGVVQSASLSFFQRDMISVAVVVLAWVLLERLWKLWKQRAGQPEPALPELTAWMFGPYVAVYVSLVSVRAIFSSVQDRYLLLLIPAFAVWGLWIFEHRFRQSVGRTGWLALAFMAIWGACGLHTLSASAIATDRLDLRLRRAGIRRGEVSEGFSKDIWAQMQMKGRMDGPTVRLPPGVHAERIPHWDLKAACLTGYDDRAGQIRPQYFTAEDAGASCFLPTDFPPESFRAWLPPFHRQIRVFRTADGAHADYPR